MASWSNDISVYMLVASESLPWLVWVWSRWGLTAWRFGGSMGGSFVGLEFKPAVHDVCWWPFQMSRMVDEAVLRAT